MSLRSQVKPEVDVCNADGCGGRSKIPKPCPCPSPDCTRLVGMSCWSLGHCSLFCQFISAPAPSSPAAKKTKHAKEVHVINSVCNSLFCEHKTNRRDKGVFCRNHFRGSKVCNNKLPTCCNKRPKSNCLKKQPPFCAECVVRQEEEDADDEATDIKLLNDCANLIAGAGDSSSSSGFVEQQQEDSSSGDLNENNSVIELKPPSLLSQSPAAGAGDSSSSSGFVEQQQEDSSGDLKNNLSRIWDVADRVVPTDEVCMVLNSLYDGLVVEGVRVKTNLEDICKEPIKANVAIYLAIEDEAKKKWQYSFGDVFSLNRFSQRAIIGFTIEKKVWVHYAEKSTTVPAAGKIEIFSIDTEQLLGFLNTGKVKQYNLNDQESIFCIEELNKILVEHSYEVIVAKKNESNPPPILRTQSVRLAKLASQNSQVPPPPSLKPITKKRGRPRAVVTKTEFTKVGNIIL